MFQNILVMPPLSGKLSRSWEWSLLNRESVAYLARQEWNLSNGGALKFDRKHAAAWRLSGCSVWSRVICGRLPANRQKTEYEQPS